MDLRTRKQIKNKCLRGFEDAVENYNPTAWQKFKTRWNEGGGQMATNAAVTTLGAAQQFNSMKFPTNYAGDFIGKYGTNNYGSIDGINYQQYNDIDTNAEQNRMSQTRDNKIMSGATLGASAGTAIGTTTGMLLGAKLGGLGGPIGMVAGLGLGALLGGIFGNKGKNEEEEQMRIAQIKQNNANEFWRTGALSTALRNKELEQYGDTTRFNLFSSALGSENVDIKDGKTTKKVLAHTSRGIEKVKANSKLNAGEIVRNKKKGTEHLVTGNPNKIDGEYGKLEKGDDVFSSTLTIPGTNITFAQAYPEAKSAGREDELLALQPIAREMTQRYKNTDDLLHAWGGWENILATVPGMIQSWRDYNDAANDDINRTAINPFNPYERKAADLMLGRRMSAYPQMRAITNEESAQRYRTNQSGGLSAMQKTMANITNNMGSKIARANALANAQQINNQFAKENAELLNNMGQWSGDIGMRAQMFNEQQNAAAQASRTQQMAMAKRNMLDYATQFAKNAWERNQFNKMYKLYAKDVKNRQLEALGKYKWFTPSDELLDILNKKWTNFDWGVPNITFETPTGDVLG